MEEEGIRAVGGNVEGDGDVIIGIWGGAQAHISGSRNSGLRCEEESCRGAEVVSLDISAGPMRAGLTGEEQSSQDPEPGLVVSRHGYNEGLLLSVGNYRCEGWMCNGGR